MNAAWLRTWLVAALALWLPLAACAQDFAGDDQARLDEVGSLYARYHAEAFPGAADISAQEAARLSPGQVVFIDVRPEEERLVSTIPGSVTVDEFLGNAEAYMGRLGVAFCTISYRSGELVQEWGGQVGGVNVVNLSGGLLAWAHAGGPLVDASGEPVKRLHVFGKRWDLAPQDFETVW